MALKLSKCLFWVVFEAWKINFQQRARGQEPYRQVKIEKIAIFWSNPDLGPKHPKIALETLIACRALARRLVAEILFSKLRKLLKANIWKVSKPSKTFQTLQWVSEVGLMKQRWKSKKSRFFGQIAISWCLYIILVPISKFGQNCRKLSNFCLKNFFRPSAIIKVF